MRKPYKDMSPVLVFDCHCLGYQAFYTMSELSHRGDMTGILHGFLTQVLSAMYRFKTNQVVFCWDSKTSKRKELYPSYKANRKIDDPEKLKQILRAKKMFRKLRKDILPGLGFKNIFQQAGYEADDLIASVVRNNVNQFVIVSSDHDLYQLLNGNISIWNPMHRKMTTYKSFKETYGVFSNVWMDVKTIAGCDGDNVPGVKGVGEKTCIKYLSGKLSKKSVVVQKIKDFLTSPECIRNLELVRLPFKGTRICKIDVPDILDPSKFHAVLKPYKLRMIEKELVKFLG